MVGTGGTSVTVGCLSGLFFFAIRSGFTLVSFALAFFTLVFLP